MVRVGPKTLPWISGLTGEVFCRVLQDHSLQRKQENNLILVGTFEFKTGSKQFWNDGFIRDEKAKFLWKRGA